LLLGMYIAPWASEGFNEFKYQYLKGRDEARETTDVFRQINDHEYIYATNFQPKTNTARNFILEHFEGNELKFKIQAARLEFDEETGVYTLNNFEKRIVGPRSDSLISHQKTDTILPFEFDELTP